MSLRITVSVSKKALTRPPGKDDQLLKILRLFYTQKPVPVQIKGKIIVHIETADTARALFTYPVSEAIVTIGIWVKNAKHHIVRLQTFCLSTSCV